jgi:hypothetical protein
MPRLWEAFRALVTTMKYSLDASVDLFTATGTLLEVVLPLPNWP